MGWSKTPTGSTQRLAVGAVWLALAVSGCVDRYPNSQYISTYTTGTSGGTGQDAASGGATDAVSSAQDTGGGGGGQDVALSPLELCLSNNCPTQVTACYYDQLCWGTLNCVSACNNPDCKNACMGTGDQVLLNLLQCATQYCSPFM